MQSKQLFEGEKVKLTALDPERDSIGLTTLSADPSFFQFTFDAIFRPLQVEQVKKKFKEFLKESADGRKAIYFALKNRKDDAFIGLLHYGWILPTHQTATLFLNFTEADLFTEFGREVIQIALEYAFMEMSLNRLQVILPAYDDAMIKMFEAAGFKREVQRRDNLFHNGEYYDELGYAILRAEWLTAKIGGE